MYLPDFITQWCFAHPYLTCFIAIELISSVVNLIKWIFKPLKKKSDEKPIDTMYVENTQRTIKTSQGDITVIDVDFHEVS